jgi:transcriptional regulator with XRE-family HTH domain
MKPRNRPQKVTVPPKREIKNTLEIARIEEVLIKVGKRVELAAGIGVSEGRISEYMAGKRMPTPEAWIKLGKLADEYGLPDPFYYWGKAGIDRQALRSMASKITEEQSHIVGATAPIPRIRFTQERREGEEVGSPIQLDSELVTNPLAMICVLLDESTTIVSAPHGIAVLDTSCKGTSDLRPLWGRLVMLDYQYELAPYGPEGGMYLGRLDLSLPSIRGKGDTARTRASLAYWETPSASLTVGFFQDPEGWAGIDQEDEIKWSQRTDEIRDRSLSGIQLLSGVKILGEVKHLFWPSL